MPYNTIHHSNKTVNISLNTLCIVQTAGVLLLSLNRDISIKNYIQWDVKRLVVINW